MTGPRERKDIQPPGAADRRLDRLEELVSLTWALSEAGKAHRRGAQFVDSVDQDWAARAFALLLEMKNDKEVEGGEAEIR
jgi:hypothetical protein